MIKAIIQWSLDNRVIVVVLSMILLGVGLFSLSRTPLDAIPDLSDVQVIIKTSYPGQAPQVVEDQVTYPLTTAMLAVPRAVTVRGYSFFGDSYVYVIFEDGTDLYWARSRVLEYLSQVAGDLPESAKPELGPDATGVGWIYQYALIDRTGQHDIADLTSLQNWFLKFELQSVPGVAEVATIGGMVRQYQVTVDPQKLRIFKLTLADVRRAIVAGNQEVGGSVIELAEAEYMIRARGYVTSVDDLALIPVGRLANGTPIMLDDIAVIDVGPQMRRGIGELNGEGEAVGGVIIMRWGENALATIDAVKARLEALKLSLPPGVEIIATYDRSSLIARAIANLKEKLTEEFAVVALLCGLFLLHLRSSLVIILTLPLGILCAFTIMNLQGINANIMSLGGIAIAIGTMVDGAIVMLEAVHRQLEQSPPADAAAHWRLVSKAAHQVGPAIFYSLLIITVSFMPVFALEAQEGRLFKPLAFTKTYAMAAASILAITLVPVLIGYFVRGRILPETKNPMSAALRMIYRPLLSVTVRHPLKIVVFSVAVCATAVVPASRLGAEFMPDLDEGDILYMPSTFPGISIGKVRQVLQQANKLIATVPEVETVYGKAGRADSATDPAPLTMIESTIRLKPSEQWREGMTAARIRAELNRVVRIPGVANVWIMPIKNRLDMLATGIKTPLGIKIAGPNLNTIAEIGEAIEHALKDVAGTASIYAERVVGGRYIEVDVRREEAARFGMSVADVQDIVRSAIGGSVISESVEGLERYPINLRFPRDYRDSVKNLRDLPVVTSAGAQLTLERLATIDIVDGPPMIRSEDARLNGWVYVDISGRDLASYVDEAKRVVTEKVTLPTGYSLAWSGQFQYLERAERRLALIIPVTIAVIVLILFLAFRRTPEVCMVLLSVPLALSGGIWILYLLDYNLSIAVAVGFIALGGLAVETSVVMLVYLNEAYESLIARARAGGQTPTVADLRLAVQDGALLRLRPIAMTAATVIFGLLPIMLGSGTGSEVMRRIAAPMVGGVVSATLLTLLILPAVFLLWRQWELRQN
jgi:Cu(I)/Ag(I) efflux system membrane protein CusA/SilA